MYLLDTQMIEALNLVCVRQEGRLVKRSVAYDTSIVDTDQFQSIFLGVRFCDQKENKNRNATFSQIFLWI